MLQVDSFLVEVEFVYGDEATGVDNVCIVWFQDADEDWVVDTEDNCLDTYNPDQTDTDGDGIGDVCDSVCCVERGDIDHAGNGIDISDLVYLVDYMFVGGLEPVCFEEADINGVDGLDISDLVYLVDYMFVGGPPPVPCGAVPPLSKFRAMSLDGLSVEYRWHNGSTTISLNSPIDIRGVQLELQGRGSAGPINLVGDRLDLVFGHEGETIKLGLLDLDGAEVLRAGSSQIIRLDGIYEIVGAKVADTRPQTYLPDIVVSSKEAELPFEYSLSQNYPNPFNPRTEISFGLPEASYVKLEVFNVIGQRVSTLADGDYQAGRHSVTWDASSFGSGVYFYRLATDTYTESRKMLLLK